MITREDLNKGLQSVQSGHAAIQYIFEHPECAKNWFDNSNYLAFLAVSNEQDLINLTEKAIEKNIKFSIFREPDIDNAITAIALEPGIKSKKICANLKLALKE